MTQDSAYFIGVARVTDPRNYVRITPSVNVVPLQQDLPHLMQENHTPVLHTDCNHLAGTQVEPDPTDPILGLADGEKADIRGIPLLRKTLSTQFSFWRSSPAGRPRRGCTMHESGPKSLLPSPSPPTHTQKLSFCAFWCIFN